MFKRLPKSLSPTMSKLDASTASVAALDAADGKYDDADDDDDRKLSPLAPGGMMTERGDDNIVPARCANAAFASHSSVMEDEDTFPATSASSSSTGGASSRRGRGYTISTVASASTTELIQRGDTMKDRVAKRLLKAAFGTPASPTGEMKRRAHMAFSGLVKNDLVYNAIVEYAGDEVESQDICGMCISNAGMEGNIQPHDYYYPPRPQYANPYYYPQYNTADPRSPQPPTTIGYPYHLPPPSADYWSHRGHPPPPQNQNDGGDYFTTRHHSRSGGAAGSDMYYAPSPPTTTASETRTATTGMGEEESSSVLNLQSVPSVHLPTSCMMVRDRGSSSSYSDATLTATNNDQNENTLSSSTRDDSFASIRPPLSPACAVKLIANVMEDVGIFLPNDDLNQAIGTSYGPPAAGMSYDDDLETVDDVGFDEEEIADAIQASLYDSSEVRQSLKISSCKSVADEAIDYSTRKLRSSSKAKSADDDVISIEDSEDEGDDMHATAIKTQSGVANKKNVEENKLLLDYPFDVDEEILREASRDLLELGGDLLGVQDDEPSVEYQLVEDDVTRVTNKPRRTHHVTIRDADYERLSPGIFLNDALVDFWMRWISRGESQLPSSDVHFFTSHFMSELKRIGTEAVVSWTEKKDINIFEKKLIFIPVNADLHWSLLAVVNPGMIANFYNDDLPATEDHSFILSLDSLNMHNKHVYANHIRQWLNSEHRRLGRGNVGGRLDPFTRKSMPVVAPKIPLQDNGCDCGVFVCRYAYNLYIMRHHRFTWKGYEDSFTSLITNSPAFQFDMFEIARIRKEMTTLVDNLSKVYLRWLKEQELADRTNDVNPVMPNHNNNSNRRGSISSSKRSIYTPNLRDAAAYSPDPANSSAADDADDMWELTKIYTLNELKKSKPIMCSNDNCGLVACSRWESTDGGKPWNSCLDCQAADYGGWPGRDEQELPVDHITKEHRRLIVEECSNPDENPYPDMPDLPLVPEEEEKEEEYDDEEKGDSKPRAKRNPPRNRRVNDGKKSKGCAITPPPSHSHLSNEPITRVRESEASTESNKLIRCTNSTSYTNESKYELIKYVESFNGQRGAAARASKKFGIKDNIVSNIMKRKSFIIHAVETGSKRQSNFRDQEIKQLRELVSQHGEDWKLIETIMHRSERSLNEKWKQLLEADKCVNVNDFPNMPIELRRIIKDGGYAYHISSTGPGDMTGCTSDIKMRIIERMKTRRTDELNEYLSTCNDKSVSVIIPAKQLQESEYDFSGSKEREHPHLYNTKTKKFRCDPSDYVYVCNDVFKGINKHRFATERTKYYGPSGSHNKWFYINAIDPVTHELLNFQPVGLSYFDPYFKKSDCPVKVHSCFKVTYDGNDINNATFKKVYAIPADENDINN